ncbi:maltokinase N-terminal cap-like domain-containing protein [Paraliomyxa miuraensis]|uniref:maltokinase N-terminal cap-like domain-containing protein n=1 Tax=Paraliomyxa miuraensis TaxID=376150 RepID=UPI002B1CABEC|nr:hypothetical protein [Paraliomyxa miuraensis]
MPSLRSTGSWAAVLDDPAGSLSRILPEYLAEQRWFAGKSRSIDGVELVEVLTVPRHDAVLLLLEVSYDDALPETYQLPLTFVSGARAHELEHEHPRAVLAHLTVEPGPAFGVRAAEPDAGSVSAPGPGAEHSGVLVDACYEPGFGRAMVEAIGHRLRLRGRRGSAHGVRTRAFAQVWGTEPLERVPPRVGSAEQSNTSIVFRDRAILKLYRRVRDGRNPDVELGRWLTEHAGFEHSPPMAGHVTYACDDGHALERADLAVMHGFVRNEGDAWSVTLDAVERFLEAHWSAPSTAELAALESGVGADPFALALEPSPEHALELVGSSVELAQRLGTRTAELHVALAAPSDDPALGTEAFTSFHRRSLFQSLRNLTAKTFQALSARLTGLPEPVRDQARAVLALERPLVAALRSVMGRSLHALRIRTHGDFHLGQALHTGRDVVLIDFEGEPTRSFEERRSRRCPLRDVASMVRSFHYAAHTVLERHRLTDPAPSDHHGHVAALVTTWYRVSAAEYVRSYLRRARHEPFLARAPDDEVLALLRIYAAEKAIYELGYELHHRPDHVAIPLEGIAELARAWEIPR